MKICPNVKECPLLMGMLAGKELFLDFYRSTYCEAGEEKYNKCKRFIVKNIYGKFPSDLLPNSSLSIEEIIKKYDLVK